MKSMFTRVRYAGTWAEQVGFNIGWDLAFNTHLQIYVLYKHTKII